MNKYHVWSPDLDQVNGIDIDAEAPRQAADAWVAGYRDIVAVETCMVHVRGTDELTTFIAKSPIEYVTTLVNRISIAQDEQREIQHQLPRQTKMEIEAWTKQNNAKFKITGHEGEWQCWIESDEDMVGRSCGSHRCSEDLQDMIQRTIDAWMARHGHGDPPSPTWKGDPISRVIVRLLDDYTDDLHLVCKSGVWQIHVGHQAWAQARDLGTVIQYLLRKTQARYQAREIRELQEIHGITPIVAQDGDRWTVQFGDFRGSGTTRARAWRRVMAKWMLPEDRYTLQYIKTMRKSARV